MKINVNHEITNIIPSFRVIAYTMDVDNLLTPEVEKLLRETEEKYHNICDILEVVNLPKLKSSRDGYKKLGKDPSRYRVATESLIRRVVKGLELYRIGDLVDLGNILSIMTMRSVCVVDLDKIVGNVNIRLGTSDDIYYGINRGLLNISKIPVYEDDISPFGTPTSDTIRTAISSETKRILIMLICFDSYEQDQDERLLLDLYQKYANATNITKL